jgi:hypothetical protein
LTDKGGFTEFPVQGIDFRGERRLGCLCFLFACGIQNQSLAGPSSI